MGNRRRPEPGIEQQMLEALENIVKSNWAIVQAQKKEKGLPTWGWLAIGLALAPTIGPALVQFLNQ